ncbi:MAG: anti-sigma-I factor RsgI family protein [Saccharofermentanales bacterium]|jgi:hypothetical protein
MKYIVIEQCKTYSVLLSENGQFYKAADLNYELGETVENPVLMNNKLSSSLDLKWYEFKNKLRYSKMRSVLVSLALVVLLVIGGFSGLYYRDNYLLTKSSIIMQINPRVELDLNAKGSVIKLTGLNPDGETLLKDYKLPSKDKIEVTNDLIKRARDLNFLKAGGKVTLGIKTKDEQTFTELGIELREKINPSQIVIEIVKAENLPETESDYQTIPENFITEITIKQKESEQTTSDEDISSDQTNAPNRTKNTSPTTATGRTTTSTGSTTTPAGSATTPNVSDRKTTTTSSVTTKPTVNVTTTTVVQHTTTGYADSNYGDSDYGNVDDIDYLENDDDSDYLENDDEFDDD